MPQVVETLYSHHKKLVLVDVKGDGDTRHIVAFLGGLDLCKGRYDTPQHSLFTNLDTTFNGDFYNRTFHVSILWLNHTIFFLK